MKKKKTTVGYIVQCYWGPAVLHDYGEGEYFGSGGGKHRYATVFASRADALTAINADGQYRQQRGHEQMMGDKFPRIIRLVSEASR